MKHYFSPVAFENLYNFFSFALPTIPYASVLFLLLLAILLPERIVLLTPVSYRTASKSSWRPARPSCCCLSPVSPPECS